MPRAKRLRGWAGSAVTFADFPTNQRRYPFRDPRRWDCDVGWRCGHAIGWLIRTGRFPGIREEAGSAWPVNETLTVKNISQCFPLDEGAPRVFPVVMTRSLPPNDSSRRVRTAVPTSFPLRIPTWWLRINREPSLGLSPSPTLLRSVLCSDSALLTQEASPAWVKKYVE
jgi:hypothetical protein